MTMIEPQRLDPALEPGILLREGCDLGVEIHACMNLVEPMSHKRRDLRANIFQHRADFLDLGVICLRACPAPESACGI
jgi:hypothetical protein